MSQRWKSNLYNAISVPDNWVLEDGGCTQPTPSSWALTLFLGTWTVAVQSKYFPTVANVLLSAATGCAVPGIDTDGPIPPGFSRSYSAGVPWDHGDAGHIQLLVPLHPVSGLVLLWLANPRARRQKMELGQELDCVEVLYGLFSNACK